MCDYSLYAIQNRLAERGEELVLHRFSSGALGFASVCDLKNAAIQEQQSSFWSNLKRWVCQGSASSVPAVCIPPGATLLLTGVPEKLQRSLAIGPSEVVTFTEISAHSYSYRDSLVLPNGTSVLLQDLTEGIHAQVLSLTSELAPSPADLAQVFA